MIIPLSGEVLRSAQWVDAKLRCIVYEEVLPCIVCGGVFPRTEKDELECREPQNESLKESVDRHRKHEPRARGELYRRVDHAIQTGNGIHDGVNGIHGVSAPQRDQLRQLHPPRQPNPQQVRSYGP